MGLVRAEGWIPYPQKQQIYDDQRTARDNESATRTVFPLSSASSSSGGEFTATAETAGPGFTDITPAGFLTEFTNERLLQTASISGVFYAGTGQVGVEISIWNTSESAWRWKMYGSFDNANPMNAQQIPNVQLKRGDRIMLRKWRNTAGASYKIFVGLTFSLPAKQA